MDSKFKIINFPNETSIKYLSKDSECKRYLDTLVKDDIGEIIIDTDKDKIAGYVFINNKKDKGFIFNLIVKKEYRRQGLGTILAKDAMYKYKGKDLTVRKDNEVAVNLYKKLGFIVVGDGNSDKEYYMVYKPKMTKEMRDKLLEYISERVNENLLYNDSVLYESLDLNSKKWNYSDILKIIKKIHDKT